MKKKKLSLDRKLLLTKELIGPLNQRSQQNIAGGATAATCSKVTCPTASMNTNCATATTVCPQCPPRSVGCPG